MATSTIPSPRPKSNPTGDLRTTLRDLRAAEAEWNAATEDDPARAEDGSLPPDDPRVRRFYAARDALVTARPVDLCGLSAQVRYYHSVTEHSIPGPDLEAMLAHVAEQLEALAGQRRAAGPLSSTF